jgi:hypothetical protein
MAAAAQTSFCCRITQTHNPPKHSTGNLGFETGTESPRLLHPLQAASLFQAANDPQAAATFNVLLLGAASCVIIPLQMPRALSILHPAAYSIRTWVPDPNQQQARISYSLCQRPTLFIKTLQPCRAIYTLATPVVRTTILPLQKRHTLQHTQTRCAADSVPTLLPASTSTQLLLQRPPSCIRCQRSMHVSSMHASRHKPALLTLLQHCCQPTSAPNFSCIDHHQASAASAACTRVACTRAETNLRC